MATQRVEEGSSSTSTHTYHVFLSFRGKDTRKTFTDHLYTALVNAGFRTFIDDDGIERGENIKLELQRAIQESRISIVVFSKDYASSSWCLDELVMILKRKKSSAHVVLPIFYGVDPSQVRRQTGDFAEAFARHEEGFKSEVGGRNDEWMNRVKGWRAALGEVADLAGMDSQNQANVHESKFIQKIVKVVEGKLNRKILSVSPYLVGMQSRAGNINLWIQNGSTDAGIVAICGMGGIGKTTIAKFVYNSNFSNFESSCFLANIRKILKAQNGLVDLQKQLLSAIQPGRKEKIYSVDEGIVKIKDALCCKRVLIVLDDVDKREQLDAVLGMRDWLSHGSKIIITTRHEWLVRHHEMYKVYQVREFDCDESLELFSWHAFGQNHLVDGYVEDSKRIVDHCGGLPLAIEVLGSSLYSRDINLWRSHIEKLKTIPNSEIFEKLKISFDSLEDDHDKYIFLHVACFFVGKDKDWTITILNGCGFHALIGIDNLINRCLLTINKHNELEMHQLTEQMGKEIVRRESPKEPGGRSRLWNHEDSFDVLTEKTGTKEIEGLILNIQLLKANNYAMKDFEESLNNSLLGNISNSLKWYGLGIFSRQRIGNALGNSNHVAFEVDTFAELRNLKLLQLNCVQLRGSYKKFPKGLRWLCWQEFPLQSMPNDFPMERLVVLEMRNSSLKEVFNGTKYPKLLKILDLSDSSYLAKTPNFSILPNLERLKLTNCVNLVEVHESIGDLQRLVLLNLRDCKNLWNLPRSIVLLRCLEVLDISGCSNLEQLPTEFQNMESLIEFHADGIDVYQSLFTSEEVQTGYSLFRWLLKPRKSPEYSWSYLPRLLVKLSLVDCNLSEDDFPNDIGNLSSLRKLNLSNNPICSLPAGIRDHTGLEILFLESCTRLRSLEGLRELKYLNVRGCKLLEKVKFLSPPVRVRIRYSDCENLEEFGGVYKLERIENVDIEILDNLGLPNLESLQGKPNVNLYARRLGTSRNLPLRGCHESHMFYAYVPGSKVPDWFNIKNRGSSISFTVPSHPNFRIQALSVCSVYGLSDKRHRYRDRHRDRHSELKRRRYLDRFLHIIVSNRTKSVIWSYCPHLFGIPEDKDQDLMWLSYWRFEVQLEVGDELNISVVGVECFEVKEVGVHLVFEKERTTSQSTRNEEMAHQIYPYDNAIPGRRRSRDIVSAQQAKAVLYFLGYHEEVCKDCPEGYFRRCWLGRRGKPSTSWSSI